MLTTTLKDIRAAGPCDDGWRKLLDHVGVSAKDARNDTTELPISTVLRSNGFDDTLWVLDNVVRNKRIISLFGADCAESVLHIFEAERPDDRRPRKAIEVARDPAATASERAAASADASAAALDAVSVAASAAAWAAAGAAASVAARAAARDTQARRLLQYLEHGEAAASMPWPKKEAA